MQSAEQSPAQSTEEKPWQFKPGQSGNPRGRESKAARQARLEKAARSLARSFGGWSRLALVDRTRLLEAVALLDTGPRTHEDRTRRANAVQRLLASVERSAGRRGAPGTDFATLLPDGPP